MSVVLNTDKAWFKAFLKDSFLDLNLSPIRNTQVRLLAPHKSSIPRLLVTAVN